MGFTCWTQFVSMLFCQLARADSLREIRNGLGCCLGRLVHVEILRAPCRSTLSYANEHRPAALFEDLFFTALARFREQQGLGTRKHKFRFKNKLLSLDLCVAKTPSPFEINNSSPSDLPPLRNVNCRLEIWAPLH
jgi:uncharacterized protein DUF4372